MKKGIFFQCDQIDEVMLTESDIHSALNGLGDNLRYMIQRNNHERPVEIEQEIWTDIFLPKIKEAYQESIDYLMWGSKCVHSRGRLICNTPRYNTKYQNNNEDEEEDSEDE